MNRTMARAIVNCDWQVPPGITLSSDCMDLLSKIFVKSPQVGAACCTLVSSASFRCIRLLAGRPTAWTCSARSLSRASR